MFRRFVFVAAVIMTAAPLAAQSGSGVFSATERAQASFFNIKLDSTDEVAIKKTRAALSKAIATMERALAPTKVMLTSGPTIRRLASRIAALERQAKDLRTLTQAFASRGAREDTSFAARIFLEAGNLLRPSARDSLRRRLLAAGVASIPSTDQIFRVVDEAVRKSLQKYLPAPSSSQ